MLSPVTAVRFDKRMGSGRTKPCILACEQSDGAEVELVVKFAAGCDMKERSLMTEAIAALLAADLGLPVPQPFIVDIAPDFVATITANPEVRAMAQASIGWNFGSQKLPPGFMTIPKDKTLPLDLVIPAAEILAFDAFIANPDRSVTNPNCLFNGTALAIFDHELAFFTDGIIGWQPPWVAGSISFPRTLPPRAQHVFAAALRGQPLVLDRFAGAFEAITDARLQQYRDALPPEWIPNGAAVDRILGYIGQLKANIGDAIKNLLGALR